MRFKIAGVVAALLSLTTVVLNMGASWYLEQSGADGRLPGWLPQLETAGQTAVAYLWVSRAATFALSVLCIAGLGYWLGSRLDLSAAYRSLLAAFAIGGGTGHLLGVQVFGQIVHGAFVGFRSALSIAVVLGPVLATGLQFALLGLAGAALAEFGVEPGFHHRNLTTPDSDARLDTE